MNADNQTSFTVEATGKAPGKGLWDCPVEMNVVYQFKNPDWTLEWGQPGNKVGETEFGNVFWGENGHLVLEWEGGYRPANPEAINFKLPPGGQEVYRTDEYEDFNMNHKADWFKSIREGHLRPAVDIEIAHRTATLCNLGNLVVYPGPETGLGRRQAGSGGRRTGQPAAEQTATIPLCPVAFRQRNPGKT